MGSGRPMSILVLSPAACSICSPSRCIDVVEQAFRLHAEGRPVGPGVLSVPSMDGGFHIKAAGLLGRPPILAAEDRTRISRQSSALRAAHDPGGGRSRDAEMGSRSR